MEYAPPEFSFPGLQFNPDIFENPLPEAPAGAVPDPLPIGELDTNSIQALAPSSPVSLYQNALLYLNLGWDLLPEINIRSLASYIRADQVGIQDLTDTCKMLFDTAINTATLTFFPNTTVTGFRANQIASTNAAVPTADDQGTLQITGATLKTPNSLEANDTSSVLNLFGNQTALLSLGKEYGTTRLTNILTAQRPIDPQYLFTTTTSEINVGGASTLRLVTPNSLVSAAVGTIQRLYSTTTADIFLGNSTAASISQLNLNAQNNGVVNIASAANRTQDVNILNGASSSGDFLVGDSTTYNGSIRLAAGVTTNLNTVEIGSNLTTTTILRGLICSIQPQTTSINTGSGTGNVNISSGTSTGTVQIGNSAITAVNVVGATNINTTGVSATSIGGAGGTTTMLGTVNVNASGSSNTNIGSGTNTGTITIGNSSTTTLNIGEAMTPTYGYDISAGTNVVGTVGYIYRGSVTTGALPNSSLQTHGTISNVPVGVYYVYASVCVDTTTVGQITYQQYTIDTGVDTNPFAILGIATGTAPGNCTDRTYFGNLSGVTCLTSTQTIRVRTFWQFSSGTFTRSGISFNFAAVRIA